MADVARAAGVSAQTVSRVSTGRVNVDAETRERVVAAMKQLGYRPNRAARALKYGRFHSLGVIASNLTSYGTTRVVNAIAVEASRAGYSLTLIPLESPDAAAVAGAFATLGEHSVDGIVVMIERHRLDAAAVTFPPGLPAVAVDTSRPTPYAVVDNDEQRGAALATEHLLHLGHTTVWHIAGPADSHSAEVRRLSWQATLERHGAQVPPMIRGDWSAESGYTAGVELARDYSVTAIFAANDQMALGAMRALSESGRRIPLDVSVVGFDDMPESANFLPPLTTVHQGFDRIGVECVAALLDEIENGSRRSLALVPVDLVERASTAPPPHAQV